MKELQELAEKVKEDNLTKTQLEQYHTAITFLDTTLRLEIAPIEKEEAVFFMVWKKENPQRTDIDMKREWRSLEKGQRQIELSHMLKVTPKLLQSIKTRLYTIY